MDADAKKNEALAKKYGVGSFPTIIFFSKDNKEGEHYEGGRDEEDLVNFMNEKCGTYRAVGGGLNDKVLNEKSANSLRHSEVVLLRLAEYPSWMQLLPNSSQQLRISGPP